MSTEPFLTSVLPLKTRAADLHTVRQGESDRHLPFVVVIPSHESGVGPFVADKISSFSFDLLICEPIRRTVRFVRWITRDSALLL